MLQPGALAPGYNVGCTRRLQLMFEKQTSERHSKIELGLIEAIRTVDFFLSFEINASGVSQEMPAFQITRAVDTVTETYLPGAKAPGYLQVIPTGFKL